MRNNCFCLHCQGDVFSAGFFSFAHSGVYVTNHNSCTVILVQLGRYCTDIQNMNISPSFPFEDCCRSPQSKARPQLCFENRGVYSSQPLQLLSSVWWILSQISPDMPPVRSWTLLTVTCRFITHKSNKTTFKRRRLCLPKTSRGWSLWVLDRHGLFPPCHKLSIFFLCVNLSCIPLSSAHLRENIFVCFQLFGAQSYEKKCICIHKEKKNTHSMKDGKWEKLWRQISYGRWTLNLFA